MLVYNSNYCLCTLYGRQCRVYRRTQRNKAMFVWRRNLNHRHIARQCAASVEFLCLAQKDGDVVCISGLYVFPYVPSYKESLVEKYSLIFCICVWSGSLGMKMVDSYILEFPGVSSSAKGVYQDFRSACNTAEVYVVSTLDVSDSLFCRNEFNFLMHDLVCLFVVLYNQ